MRDTSRYHAELVSAILPPMTKPDVPSPLWIAIERRMKALHMNMSELSEKAGLGATGIRDIRRGKSTNPKSRTLDGIAKALGCTATDLLREMVEVRARHVKSIHGDSEGTFGGVRDQKFKPTATIGGKPPKMRDFAMATTVAEGEIVEADTPLVFIPEYDAAVGAGGGGFYEANNYHASPDVVGHYGFPAEGFRQAFGAMPEKVVVLPIIGDSMIATLFPGQRVLVDLGDRTPSPPGLFVVFDGLTRVVKRVEYIPDSNPPTIRIMSDNPKYTPYQRTLEEARIEGRVIGVWARM